MGIEFGKRFARDTVDPFGIAFEATVDGAKIRIRVRCDALQDIAPDRATDSAESQFSANRFYFEEIAIALIEKGEAHEGVLTIEGKHVRE